MKSIEFSPNSAAIWMQRLPPEVALHKLGVNGLTDLLEFERDVGSLFLGFCPGH